MLHSILQPSNITHLSDLAHRFLVQIVHRWARSAWHHGVCGERHHKVQVTTDISVLWYGPQKTKREKQQHDQKKQTQSALWTAHTVWSKKCKSNEVVPGIELGLPESESDVLTITLYNHWWRQISAVRNMKLCFTQKQRPIDSLNALHREEVNVVARLTLKDPFAIQSQGTKGNKNGVEK